MIYSTERDDPLQNLLKLAWIADGLRPIALDLLTYIKICQLMRKKEKEQVYDC